MADDEPPSPPSPPSRWARCCRGSTAARAILLLDVRNEEEFETWKVEARRPVETVHVPYFDFIEDADASIAKVPRGRDVVVLCAQGGSSEMVAGMLQEAGIPSRQHQGRHDRLRPLPRAGEGAARRGGGRPLRALAGQPPRQGVPLLRDRLGGRGGGRGPEPPRRVVRGLRRRAGRADRPRPRHPRPRRPRERRAGARAAAGRPVLRGRGRGVRAPAAGHAPRRRPARSASAARRGSRSRCA